MEQYTEQEIMGIKEKHQKRERSKRWFETKYIKDEKELTLEQVNYLRKYSITVLGLWPLNILVRKQWDLLITLVVIHFLQIGLVAFGVLQNVAVFSIYLPILLSIVGIGILYFGLKYGRRLAWNRNEWKSFDAFKKSEKVWTPLAWITVALYVLLIVIH